MKLHPQLTTTPTLSARVSTHANQPPLHGQKLQHLNASPEAGIQKTPPGCTLTFSLGAENVVIERTPHHGGVTLIHKNIL